MPNRSRFWGLSFWALASSLWVLASPPCWAGSGPRVRSSITRIELAPDGSARVRHQLRLEARSGVLRSFTLQGLDADAEPLPDARITRNDSGAGAPQPLELRLAGGRAELGLPRSASLPGKSFSIEFGYRTQLLRRGLLREQPGGQRMQLSWVGPRFEDSVDSVTLVVRTSPARLPPEPAAPDAEAGRARARAVGGPGIILSTLRRSPEWDELELVHAHVARREAARWQVLLDRALFAGTANPSDSPSDKPGKDPSASPGSSSSRGTNDSASAPAPEPEPSSEVELDGIWPAPEGGLPHPGSFWSLPCILVAAAGYGALLWLKARAVSRAAALRDCRVRPLLPGSATQRAVLAGLAVALASGAVIWLDAPLVGALILLLAVALATHRPPTSEARLRGPGEWQPLDAQTLQPERALPPPLPGAWLDVARLPGFALLLGLLASNGAAAFRLFQSSPYYGACLLLAGSALLPLFCTGRAGELPEPALAQSKRFLARVLKRLEGKAELVLQPLGRVCTGATELDELRLAIHPARGLRGLIGLELSLEQRSVLSGPSTGPVLVVRAADGSPCQRALPRQLSWSRGRSAEERAALVRPKLPSLALTVELVLELAAAASEAQGREGAPAAASAARPVSSGAPPRRRLRASPAGP
jgi:hypothetical protein